MRILYHTVMLRSFFTLRTILPLVLALSLYSCKYQEVTVGKPQGMKLKNYSQKGIEAEVGIPIKNPNRFGFAIYKSALNVKIEGVEVGDADLSKVRVKPKSDDVHYFELEVDFSKLNPADYAKLLSLVQKRSVNATIKGELKVGNLFYKKRIPINLNEKIDLNRK